MNQTMNQEVLMSCCPNSCWENHHIMQSIECVLVMTGHIIDAFNNMGWQKLFSVTLDTAV